MSRISPENPCRLNRSTQHRLVDSIDSTSPKCSIWTAVLNQDLNRAFVLFELTATNEISLLDPYERTLGKCCVDPLRPPRLSECGKPTTPVPKEWFDTRDIVANRRNFFYVLPGLLREPLI